jgi:hypothetical protein
MKHLRQISLGFFLVLALSIPKFAGEIGTPGVTDGPQESPGVTGAQESPGITGDMGNGITVDMGNPGIVSLGLQLDLCKISWIDEF